GFFGTGGGTAGRTGRLLFRATQAGDVLDQTVNDEVPPCRVVAVAAQLNEPAWFGLGRFDRLVRLVFAGSATAVAPLLVAIHFQTRPHGSHVGGVTAIEAGDVNLRQVLVGVVDIILAERP